MKINLKVGLFEFLVRCNVKCRSHIIIMHYYNLTFDTINRFIDISVQCHAHLKCISCMDEFCGLCGLNIKGMVIVQYGMVRYSYRSVWYGMALKSAPGVSQGASAHLGASAYFGSRLAQTLSDLPRHGEGFKGLKQSLPTKHKNLNLYVCWGHTKPLCLHDSKLPCRKPPCQ